MTAVRLVGAVARRPALLYEGANTRRGDDAVCGLYLHLGTAGRAAVGGQSNGQSVSFFVAFVPFVAKNSVRHRVTVFSCEGPVNVVTV